MFEIVNCSGAHPVCPALAVLRRSVSDTQAVAPSMVAEMTATVGNSLEVIASVLRGIKIRRAKITRHLTMRLSDAGLH